MEYIIRKAQPADASQIAPCLFLAMEEIVFYLFGTQEKEKALHILETFVQSTDNQYSFENCWVVVDESDKIIGACNVYAGDRLTYLRQKILDYNVTYLGRQLEIEDETQAGEYYIDCIGVLPTLQGKGIGNMLLQYLIKNYSIENQQILGLLVDFDNPKAKKLYVRLGFEVVGKKTLAGKTLEHLQYKPKK